jgi:hypothetical protein
VVGKNRFERAFTALEELKAEGSQIIAHLTCKGRRVPAVVTSFSYDDELGRTRTFELE